MTDREAFWYGFREDLYWQGNLWAIPILMCGLISDPIAYGYAWTSLALISTVFAGRDSTPPVGASRAKIRWGRWTVANTTILSFTVLLYTLLRPELLSEVGKDSPEKWMSRLLISFLALLYAYFSLQSRLIHERLESSPKPAAHENLSSASSRG